MTTLCLGGDHTVLLAELRALAAVHGPLALIQFDSHHDLWDEYFGQKLFHGSVVRRAVEEGLIDTSRSIQAGLRGSLSSAAEAGYPAELGIDASPTRSSRRSAREASPSVPGPGRHRPVLPLVRLDFVDPAFAPGTGTPEVGGPSSRDALYLRSIPRGLTSPGSTASRSRRRSTLPRAAFVAANACFEMLSLLALRR